MGQAVQQQHLTNGDMIEYSKACNFMGNCLRQMGRLHEALDTFKVGIQILENSTQQKENSLLSSILNNAGNWHHWRIIHWRLSTISGL